MSFCTRATEEIFSNLLFLPQLTHNNDKRRPYFSTVAKKLSLLLAKKVEQEEMAKVKVVRKFGGSWNMSFAIIFPSYLINWFFFSIQKAFWIMIGDHQVPVTLFFLEIKIFLVLYLLLQLVHIHSSKSGFSAAFFILLDLRSGLLLWNARCGAGK